MARKIPPPSIPAPAADAPEVSDAISLLRRDHRIVELLFDEFRRMDAAQRDPIARRICKMLNVHAQIEEELFYPAARLALRESATIDAAVAEHAQAKQLIAQIEAMTADDILFGHTVQQLADVVKEHVEEEEQKIFARLAGTRLDVVALGTALAERKVTLMEVIGLHYDDELPARPETRAPGADESAARR